MATEYKVVSGSCGLTCSIMFNSVTPWMVALQAPSSMEFLRQEYWSGMPFPSPRDLPISGIEPASLLHWQKDSLPLSHQGSP